MDASDAFRVHVDARSGLIAAANLKNQTFTSLTGDKAAEIVQVCSEDQGEDVVMHGTFCLCLLCLRCALQNCVVQAIYLCALCTHVRCNEFCAAGVHAICVQAVIPRDDEHVHCAAFEI